MEGRLWKVGFSIGVAGLLACVFGGAAWLRERSHEQAQEILTDAFDDVADRVRAEIEAEDQARINACNEECFPYQAAGTENGCYYQATDTTRKLCPPDLDADSWVEFEATAYVARPGAICKDGTPAIHGDNIMAIDPTVLEMGDSYRVKFMDGTERVYTAHDTGGAVKGNIVDLLLDDYERAIRFGRQRVWVAPVEES